MLILITYDVNTETPAGRRRLRQVAKQCVNYGQRVQNSVFECVLDTAQFLIVKDKLLKIIDASTDSLRFYTLGNNYKNKLEHYGVKPSLDVTEPLIL
jgi:CRISPR-associated protein Cas2